jgi:XTP/dITP diphosphohydrolase
MPLPVEVLYVATTNAGKVRDFAAAGAVFALAIGPLPGLREIAEPIEDGDTFEANARLKAEHYSRHAPGLWVLADDSGLEVDALNGAPGVRSARFAADEGFAGAPGMTTDERNNTCLLAKLASGDKGPLSPTFDAEAEASACLHTRSTSRYRCVLALAQNGIVERTSEGSVEGEILAQPRGTGGFGYDPLFWLPEFGMTMAEIDLVTKQRISHRGKALAAMMQSIRG